MDCKRYAIVGVGSRARLFLDAVAGTFSRQSLLVGLCDSNPARMAFQNRRLGDKFGHSELPSYSPDQFDRMIDETRPHVVIVCSIDRTHHRYINRAMELGCDVITEKPLTVDAQKCRSILETQRRTGRNIRVTFNYRYSPRNTQVRKLIADGAIGKVVSVHFEWMLDTRHGADYFRRWHRDKANSGGLMVHKATHHFDLVNWWIDGNPEEVFGTGRLAFYGRENAEDRGVGEFYDRCHGSTIAASDPFALDIENNDLLTNLYLNAEAYDGYIRDRSVFSQGISIEDTMGVLVRYDNQALLTYSLNAFCPMEGYNVTFIGTEGRIELRVVERSYVSASAFDQNNPDFNMEENDGMGGEIDDEMETLILQKLWEAPQRISIPSGEGGHGGGDALMLADIFDPGREDPLGTAAGLEAGVRSIMVGIAANRSFETSRMVCINDLL